MDAEHRHHWDLILTPVGLPWSGRARYAAAMFFFQAGEMSAEVLEIYRICCRIDGEDPLDALRGYRMGADWIGKAEAMAATLADNRQQNST
jgi:hypothetical protein